MNNDFSEEINNSNLCKRLKIMLKDKDSNSFIKLFPKIYPNLLNINSMKQQIVELTPKSLGVIEDYDINNQLENFVYNLNKINAFFFINYYLFTTGEDLYIPSFYYYKIPGPNSTEKLLIFDKKSTKNLLNYKFQNKYDKITNNNEVSTPKIDDKR